MATLQELIARTRLELADVSKSFVFTTTSVGATTTYDIPRAEQIDTASVVVRRNGNVVPSSDYVVDADDGIITITGTPPDDGDTMQFSGLHHKFFSDEAMTTFVTTAFGLHNSNRTMSLQALPANEVYLVALLAKIEALWVLATDAAYDIDIRTPEGVSVPRTQRYAQLMNMIAATEEQYKDLGMALGVGLYRIEMFTLRRTSLQTGRLVPVYLPREFDDNRQPQRISPPIDHQFSVQPEITYDYRTIQIYRGEPFSQTLRLFEPDGETGLDLTSYTYEAKIYASKHNHAEIAEFEITAINIAQGHVELSLTAEETKKILENSNHVWLFKMWDANGDPDTPLRGPVLVDADLPRGVYQL